MTEMEMLLKEQKDEITAHHIYRKLALRMPEGDNRSILLKISEDEKKHYTMLKSYTKKEVKANTFHIFFYYWISILLGLTFGLKLLERGEEDGIENYRQNDPNNNASHELVSQILKDEEIHELELLNMLNEERLDYIGSIVLGLNDALVELTGALAGYTFAFQNTKLIAVTGLITGISASFSMAASEYLSTMQEEGDEAKKAKKAAIYTGIAYVITVVFLILPFLLIANPYISLALTLFVAVFIIFVFNFYVSVAKDYPFSKRFFQMASISLGVAAISFFVGVIVKQVFGLEI
ncbi:MAG: VIT1/CCC1 transporter family protein [Vallitaleaceae bacterium]|nr:VIT1/CCC1 transporter family protein [Vallitaleaceae bacterium]